MIRDAVVVALVLWTGRAAAQVSLVPTRHVGGGSPAWMTGWSPLMPVADLERQLPHAPPFTDVLAGPAPRIGLFWTAGNPAGLVHNTSEPRAELRMGFGNEVGQYRRPQDPNGVALTRLSGIAWRRMGQGAAVGRIVAESRDIGSAPYAALVAPYVSDPLVVTDTTLPAMRRLVARLEGAIAWEKRWLSVGLSAGAEVWDNRTSEARFPRLGRASRPAVAAGVGARLPFLHARVAGQVRWIGGNETVLLAAQPDGGTVYFLDGYSEPDPRRVILPQVLFRRIDRNALALSGGLEGRFFGVQWVVFGQRERRTNEHSSVRREAPPRDRWRARGWTYGAAAQGVGLGGSLLVTAWARHTGLTGDATRADLNDAVFFRSDEDVTQGSLELRYVPRASPWRVTAAFVVIREQRVRRDFIAGVRSELRSWAPGGRAEVAHRFRSTSVSVGIAATGYTPVAVIPDASAMGPVYQALVAQELALYALRATSVAATVGAAYRQGRTTLALGVLAERLSERGNEATSLAFAPTGSRTQWRMSLRVIVD